MYIDRDRYISRGMKKSRIMWKIYLPPPLPPPSSGHEHILDSRKYIGSIRPYYCVGTSRVHFREKIITKVGVSYRYFSGKLCTKIV